MKDLNFIDIVIIILNIANAVIAGINGNIVGCLGWLCACLWHYNYLRNRY